MKAWKQTFNCVQELEVVLENDVQLKKKGISLCISDPYT